MATQAPALLKFMKAPESAHANDVKPQPIFAGFQKPSIDMEAVRDGRRAPLLYLDIPLDSVSLLQMEMRRFTRSRAIRSISIKIHRLSVMLLYIFKIPICKRLPRQFMRVLASSPKFHSHNY